ncbi:type II toxin-antitoxin system Phd/YefM family antitoxin [bacterium]|nr:type II toxin-antitoxin system Phd/YefM family antitoxin [bacterium]
MKTISISDFKSHAVQIIEHIVDTHEELLITKRGKPVAKIISYEENTSKSRPGKLSKYFISETDIISTSCSEDWEA